MTYDVEDGEGGQISAGLDGATAIRVARERAAERGVTLYVLRTFSVRAIDPNGSVRLNPREYDRRDP